MAKRQHGMRSIFLKFLLLLPIMDIPPTPPGQTGNFYRRLIERRKRQRQREGFASEVKLEGEIQLVPREQPEESQTGSENGLGGCDEG
ncbi:MAG: hypothetical protein H5T61_09560 [Thermoflexales bacterium]|nr:hypothetical protein [Thermoflexales bacterium]